MVLSVTVDGAIVIPWTVCCVDPGTSFSQLFEKLQAGSIELFQPYAAKLQHCEISQGNVSKSKDTPFSIVDKQLPVEVCCQFGSYVKLSCTCCIEQQPSTSRSHLQVTIIRCVLTVLVAGTPSRSEVVFYVV